MITGESNRCFPRGGPQNLPIYAVSHHEDAVSSSLEATSTTHSTNFVYNLSVLKDKVQQVQTLASLFISPGQNHNSESSAIAIASMGTLIQEIIVISSSMMFSCQQMAVGVGSNRNSALCVTELSNQGGPIPQHDTGRVEVVQFGHHERGQQGFNYSTEDFDWFSDHSYNNCNLSDTHPRNNVISSHLCANQNKVARKDLPHKSESREGLDQLSPKTYDIVELDAEDLLAKYTHYCQVCGKGFKRDANLRMHMRAHGEEYKSNAALSNPLKNNINGEGCAELPPRKYSCPQEGCRWNKKHAKFQPLKSMICVKNHYKRSHCPKMYVCKRCNKKQFSVLSDLRTHEKHCGVLKWQCSCGTTFSRKDKLMGHVALFVGHSPAVSSLAKMGKADQNAVQIRTEDR